MPVISVTQALSRTWPLRYGPGPRLRGNLHDDLLHVIQQIMLWLTSGESPRLAWDVSDAQEVRAWRQLAGAGPYRPGTGGLG